MRNVITYPENHNYPCEVCQKSLETLPQLETHMHAHRKELCPLCCQFFSNEEDLLEHMAEIHYKVCVFCNVGFDSRDSLNLHINILHKHELPVLIKLPPAPYEGNCKICNKHFNKLKPVKKHYFWEHLLYACDICFQLFKTSDEQVKHTEEVHMIPCPHCDVKNYTYHRFKRHLNKHTSQSSKIRQISKAPDQIYECKFCFKGLCSKENVKRHNFWCHFQHTCIICLATFSNKESEEHHFNTHGHICICCELKFKSKDKLEKHLLESHPSFLPFMCDKCGDAYKTKNELNVHITSTHEKKENYLCDICGAGFTVKYCLNIHKNIHSAVLKTFDCYFCNKSLRSKFGLETHILTKHLKYKKYKCLDCKLSYFTAKKLNVHMSTHSVKHVVLKRKIK
jgi:KRAB domain-containing zinc finger protein